MNLTPSGKERLHEQDEKTALRLPCGSRSDRRRGICRRGGNHLRIAVCGQQGCHQLPAVDQRPGGEAERVKLAKELQKKATGRTLFVLDEPTTGLHTDDIKRLLAILQKIVDNGDTVVVIEHNLDVIKVADYIIDLGPEGGEGGGEIVATGTPEEVSKVSKSYTGQFLNKIL